MGSSRRGAWFPGLLAVAAALGAFGFLYRAVRDGKTREIDERATLRLQQVRAPWFRRLMWIVSWPGFPPQSRIIPWAASLGWLLVGKPLEALFQLLAWGTGVISFAVKRSMCRPRPDHPEIEVTKANIGGSSFPSGHVLNYIGVYGFLLYQLRRERPLTWPRRIASWVLAGMLALVGVSRMYLGHHWMSDVTASYLLGGSYLFVLTRIYERVKARLAT